MQKHQLHAVLVNRVDLVETDDPALRHVVERASLAARALQRDHSGPYLRE
jgi:hypothetical protein